MIDISQLILDAAGRRRDRASVESALLLRAVGGAVNGRVSWDEAAGEDWATVLDAESIAAYVFMLAPLVVVRQRDLGRVRAAVGDDPVVVSVRDMDEETIRADRRALSELFGERVGDLDAARFSATDLWFHSI